MTEERSEAEFCVAIDARLPIDDERQLMSLIGEALGISSNCVFMVLHELVRTRPGSRGQAEAIHRAIEVVLARSSHDLLPILAPLVRQRASDKPVDQSGVAFAFRALGSWPGEVSALNIVYFLAEDPDWADAERELVIDAWDLATGEPSPYRG